MGVTVLYPYQLPEGKSGQQAVDYLQKRLVAQGAIHSGNFMVNCETHIYEIRNGVSKAVHVLHNSEYPTTTFAILDSGTNKIPLVADRILDLLLLKMTPVFSIKKPTRMESKGSRFEYGDFVIKLGSVTLMENFKGVLIEIEYQPCFVLSYCWEMMREMLSGVIDCEIPAEFPAYFAPQPIPNAMGPQATHSKHNDTYEPIDTINQYMEQFMQYRKQTAGPAATQVTATVPNTAPVRS